MIHDVLLTIGNKFWYSITKRVYLCTHQILHARKYCTYLPYTIKYTHIPIYAYKIQLLLR